MGREKCLDYIIDFNHRQLQRRYTTHKNNNSAVFVLLLVRIINYDSDVLFLLT
jgi:hypothetical protein